MPLRSPVSKRYALALVESVAGSKVISLDEALGQIASFHQAVVASPQLETALLNPAFTRDERDRIVDAVIAHLKLAPIVRSFLKLLVDNRRMEDLGNIVDSFREISDDRRGRTRAVVHSASPLSSDQLDRLKRALEKTAGRTVDIDVHVDPSLIGGIRARIGSTVFDGTIRAELERLRGQLAYGE